VENVENDMEDSEDEVLVLEDTTEGQDRENGEVIICVTMIRLSASRGSESSSFFYSWIRIHIRVKSWVRIHFKVKIQEL
jgi:hypothetical protein